MINWDEAPEGTDAAVLVEGAIAAYGQWRKFDGNEVYFHRNGQWELRGGTDAERWKRHNPHELRPAHVIVEAELPEGRVWREDYTHYNTAYNFFFKEGQAVMGLEEKSFNLPEPNYTFWLHQVDTIARFPGAKPKAPVEQPIKKKPVGWWT